MKAVVYYCPGCKQRITRWMLVSRLRYKSNCATVGREVTMRRIKDQAAALKKQREVIEL